MSLVHFELAGSLAELDPRAVAVKLRDLDLDIVAQGVASEPLDVEPGHFIAQACFANGDTATAEVAVELGKEPVVVLGTEANPQSVGRHRMSRFVTAAGSVLSRLSPPRMSLSLPMRVGRNGLRAYIRGRGFASYVPIQEIVEPSIEPRGDGSVSVRFPEYLGIDLVAVEVTGQPLTNIVLPSAAAEHMRGGYATRENGAGVELRLSRSQHEGIKATVHPRHDVADAMLAYSGKSFFAEAQALVRSQAMNAEALLYDKRADPVAAAAGAYVLLRAGELERLHDWTGNLCAWFSWLADGAAIRGEHLAREGRHEEALACLMKLDERGLPAFSDGLGYAVNRLTLYVRSGSAGEEGKKLLRALSAYALVADFRRTFTTFAGTDPNHPGEQTLDASTGAPTEALSSSESVML